MVSLRADSEAWAAQLIVMSNRQTRIQTTLYQWQYAASLHSVYAIRPKKY